LTRHIKFLFTSLKGDLLNLDLYHFKGDSIEEFEIAYTESLIEHGLQYLGKQTEWSAR